MGTYWAHLSAHYCAHYCAHQCEELWETFVRLWDALERLWEAFEGFGGRRVVGRLRRPQWRVRPQGSSSPVLPVL